MSDQEKVELHYATGRRKNAVARVWVSRGDGSRFLINEKPFDQYFGRGTSRMMVQQPFEVTHSTGQFDVKATVSGGGQSGQADAVRLGISRTLVQFDEKFKSSLRNAGLLTRDPREKERKKFGRKGARRSFQYTKR